MTAEENVGLRELERIYPGLRVPLTYKLDMAVRMRLVPLAPGASDAAE